MKSTLSRHVKPKKQTERKLDPQKPSRQKNRRAQIKNRKNSRKNETNRGGTGTQRRRTSQKREASHEQIRGLNDSLIDERYQPKKMRKQLEPKKHSF